MDGRRETLGVSLFTLDTITTNSQPVNAPQKCASKAKAFSESETEKVSKVNRNARMRMSCDFMRAFERERRLTLLRCYFSFFLCIKLP